MKKKKNMKNIKTKKKINQAGFTLIELLAVVTIMGILMLVAIPAVSRTIENTRKDTFLNTASQYVNSVKTMWAADLLECKVPGVTNPVYSSGVTAGATSQELYYVAIATNESNANNDNPVSSGYRDSQVDYPILLENGGKSSWGNRDVFGYVVVGVENKKDTDGNDYRKVTYGICLTDGIHAISGCVADGKVKSFDKPKRGQIVTITSGASSDYIMDDTRKSRMCNEA